MRMGNAEIAEAYAANGRHSRLHSIQAVSPELPISGLIAVVHGRLFPSLALYWKPPPAL